MKERYQAPEMEIIQFESEDIITTSGEENELPTQPLLNGLLYGEGK